MLRTIRQSAPKIQQTQGPKSASDFLKELDTLLKRNNGQGLFVGQDVSSNSPMYIPGKVSDPSGIGSVAPSISQFGNGMTQPTPVQREAPYQMPIDQQQPQAISIEDFLKAFNEVYSAPENQPSVSGVYSGIDMSQAVASAPDGGTIYRDGSIHYGDGTMRVGDPSAYGIASEGPGKIRYSDGSIRQAEPYGISSRGQTPDGRDLIGYTDNSTRYGQYLYGDSQPVDMPGGLSGLISGVFGQNRPITQAYGNVNPIEPTKGHVNLGTDIRTSDLSGDQRGYKLPVGATVVQVFHDDGTRFGTQSGHQGYGNSILVQLPTGEMLRFSHMSQMADVKPGDTINAGQVFGAPGATGNATGEHLDLEYYNSQGQIDNPVNFSGFTDPQGLRSPLPNQPAPGTKFEAPSQTPATDLGQSILQAPEQAYKAVAPVVASGINKLNPTGQIGFGITETLQGNPEAARAEQANTISNLGTALNAPDLNTKALSDIQGTNPFRQLAGNLVDYASTPLKKLGLPDTGVSEAIAGGKTLNTDASLVPQTYAAGEMMSKPKSPQDYASVLGQNIKDVGSTLQKDAGIALGQAGQGIKTLGQAGIDAVGNVFKPAKDVIKRAIGDVSGTADQNGQFSSLMDSAPSMTTPAKNDVRDPFFKMGGSELYKNYLKPNAQDLAGGALTLDLFTPDFYKDLGNISSVFGRSKDLGAATDKFIEFEKQKYPMMSRMSSSPEYDQGSVDQYNSEVDKYNSSLNDYFNSVRSSTKGAQSIFTPLPSSANKNVFSSKSVVPNQSQIQSPQMSSPIAPSLSRPTSVPTPVPTPAKNTFSAPSSSASLASVASKPASAPTPTPVPTPSKSPAPVSKPAVVSAPKVSAPVPVPVPTPTRAPAPQSKPTKKVKPLNVFGSALSTTAGSIFPPVGNAFTAVNTLSKINPQTFGGQAQASSPMSSPITTVPKTSTMSSVPGQPTPPWAITSTKTTPPPAPITKPDASSSYLDYAKSVADRQTQTAEQQRKQQADFIASKYGLANSQLKDQLPAAQQQFGQFKADTEQTIADLLAGGARQKSQATDYYGDAQRQAALADRQIRGTTQQTFSNLGTIDSTGQGSFGQATENQASDFNRFTQQNLKAKADKLTEIDATVETAVRSAKATITQEEAKMNELARNIQYALANNDLQQAQELTTAYNTSQQYIYDIQDTLAQTQYQFALEKEKLQNELAKTNADVAGLSQGFLQTGKPENQADFIYRLKNGKDVTDNLATSAGGKQKGLVLDTVNNILNGNVGGITGFGQLQSLMPGSSAALTKNYYDQLKSMLSLEGRAQLKGSGQISDFEAKMLEKAATMGLGQNLS
ncbi:MAG TPA: peptidoglycan DD-metalloendopeptidase family protein, partial [Myxococcota bacterium]|nr:peptidoglycan DD-metalloendopeptidase family protein [Myxococcota bacterium]